MKDSSITITDQFCGAGGSSAGATKAIAHKGGYVAVALNHWKLAVTPPAMEWLVSRCIESLEN